jgi:AcrR family transcriptional regulator
MSQTDRRVKRTKKLLQDAMVELILENGYSKVSVQDIVDRADVGRTTFYAHFQDKEDLLMSGFELLHREIVDAIHAEPDKLLPGLPLFAHAEEVVDLFKAFGAVESLMGKIRQALVKLVKERLVQRGELGVNSEGFAEFMVGGLLSMLFWWLNAGLPVPAEAMAADFERFVNSMLVDVHG